MKYPSGSIPSVTAQQGREMAPLGGNVCSGMAELRACPGSLHLLLKSRKASLLSAANTNTCVSFASDHGRVKAQCG